MSYTLYINTPEKILELPLPAASNRKVCFDLSAICSGCTLELEEYEGTWKILSSDSLSFRVNSEDVSEAEIADGGVINIYPKCGGSFTLIVKKTEPESIRFRKYSAKGKSKVTIGRSEDNDIVISDEFVGSHHCTVSLEGGFTLSDNSKNGTFVNGNKAEGDYHLNISDTVYITGHKIIFLGDVFAVCDSSITSRTLPEISPSELSERINKEKFEDDSAFSRAPRRIEPLDSEDVEIDDPPAKQKSRSQPLIFIIGPSVTMPIPILVSVLVNIVSNSGSGKSGVMYLGTALSVLLSALIGTGWALAHQMYNKKVLAEDEKERTKAYKAYIENNRNLLEEKHEKNRAILEKSYLSTEELFKAAKEHKELIWNRNIYQNDFLTIRLGLGKMKLPGEIAVSKQRFSLSDDELCKHPHELHDKYEMIDNCASLVNLMQNKIIGMVGDEDKLPLIANNIICQTAALHCYTDVKIGFIGEVSDYDNYSWVKWLPHSFFHGTEERMVSFDSDSRENVMYEIASELRRRADEAEDEHFKGALLPHIILFCTSSDIIGNSILSRYISSPVYLGVTFVLVYGKINLLPNECKAIIEDSEDFSGYYLLDEEITEENNIRFELASPEEAEAFARNISGYSVDEAEGGEIPSSVDYFEMLGIGKTDHWNLIKKYRTNFSYEGLKSFVGLGSGGNPVYLDIHDKKDGPHGLVAGTTGSGKSETLQTFILSLAMNYSPDDIAFVLIDYKGGGMANAFDGLPHVAGMITNLSDNSEAEFGELSDNLTRRAFKSLESEIKRREKIFKQYKINHIDLYSRLYHENKAAEPMPHLIIISDEFAELKKEQPEFIKELVSVSRVGRSLGIHLILATQKPSGVVDDEIWSNSRFRICLRVQDKQDSAGMLKRPDAAYIKGAGRAFLQVGNDEIFEEFQSGYSGGEYTAKDEVVSSASNEAAMISIDGSLSVVHSKPVSGENSETELSAAVKYISETSGKYGFKAARSLWLPPLAKEIVLDDIEDTCLPADNGDIIVTYGMTDNYQMQMQYPCTLNLTGISNLKICGTSGCGKTTLLQTILCSAVKKYSPLQFIFYVMDFSGRTFKMFKKLPHCGGVVYEEDTESSERLIKLMFDLIEERRDLFEKEDIGSFGEYTKLHTLPLVVFAIDNFAAFTELYGDHEEEMLRLMHDGVRYGIQIIVTVNNTSEIKYKMRSYILDSIAMRMAEKNEYNELIGVNPDFVPANVNGRGLTVSGGIVTEYQAALPARGSNESERSENMKKLFAEIAKKHDSSLQARKIPVISANVKYCDMLSDGDYSDSLLIGYDFDTILPYSVAFSSFYCFCVSAVSSLGVSKVMDNIAEYACQNDVTVKSVHLDSEVNIKLPEGSEVYTDAEGIYKLAEYFHSEFSKRNRAVTEWNNDDHGVTRDRFLAEKFGRVFVLIDDMAKFCDIIYSDKNSKNAANLMETFLRQGRNHGIHIFGGYVTSRKTYLAASNVFRAENCGIHAGGKINDQSILEINIPLAQKLKQLDANVGYCTENDHASQVYIPERK